MKLDIKNLDFNSAMPFSCAFDLSELEFYGNRPITEPLRFDGKVKRTEGSARLDGELSTVMRSFCDRCGTSYRNEKTLPLSVLLIDSPEDDDRDDTVPCPGGVCDLEEIARSAWILDMNMRNLCPDCEATEAS